MFAQDKDSIIEMYELSIEKKTWKYLLITSEMTTDLLTTKELVSLLLEWREQIKAQLSEADAAFQINAGNIFLIIHETNIDSFVDKMAEMIIFDKKEKDGILSSICFLTHEESEFLLKTPK